MSNNGNVQVLEDQLDELADKIVAKNEEATADEELLSMLEGWMADLVRDDESEEEETEATEADTATPIDDESSSIGDDEEISATNENSEEASAAHEKLPDFDDLFTQPGDNMIPTTLANSFYQILAPFIAGAEEGKRAYLKHLDQFPAGRERDAFEQRMREALKMEEAEHEILKLGEQFSGVHAQEADLGDFMKLVKQIVRLQVMWIRVPQGLGGDV